MTAQHRPSVISWRPEFATGIASIDHEHEEMIGLINQSLELLETDRDSDEIADFLGEAYARISAHFALEEQLMRKHKYDAYGEHKEDHERLLDELRDLMDAHDADTYRDERDEISVRLENWFSHHFKTMDARLHGMAKGGEH